MLRRLHATFATALTNATWHSCHGGLWHFRLDAELFSNVADAVSGFRLVLQLTFCQAKVVQAEGDGASGVTALGWMALK